MHNETPDHEKYKKLCQQNGPADSSWCWAAAEGSAGSGDRSTTCTKTGYTSYKQHRTSEREKTADKKHCLQSKSQTVREKLGNIGVTFKSNLAFVMMFVLTAVIGVLSALLFHHSEGRSPQGVSQAHSLVGSVEKHGYYDQLHRQVERRSYGSPDLVFEDSKRELANTLSKKVSAKRDSGTEHDVRKKGGSTNFLTIDVVGRRKRADGEDQYVVVFDAGSTGTRVHVYQFRFEDQDVDMVNEVYRKVKPGLSDYVNNPDKGAASIQPLVDVAMETVPQSLHSSTPLVFKATAGLRLLDASGADNLLNKVRELFATTDFSFSPDEVSIMGGTEEGLFGWVTINYLLGNLDGNSLTAAVLDLGGGSVQVTYEPENLGDFSENLAWLELFGNGYALYTQSYLGQGLKAARNGTFADAGDGTLTSDCLPVDYSGTFTYGGTDYKIKGPDALSLDGCWQQVGDFISSGNMSALTDLVENTQNPDIYLFSYFYDVLKWGGIISVAAGLTAVHGLFELVSLVMWACNFFAQYHQGSACNMDDETEKIVNVNDYYHAGQEACELPDPKEPFMCQDLTFITRLLGETFMLWDKPLHVVSQINSGETSWTLGAALDALSNLQSEE